MSAPFRLATVQRLRQTRLEDAAQALREASRGVATAAAHLDTVRTLLHEAGQHVVAATGADVALRGHHRDRLRDEVEQAVGVLDTARAAAEECREAWLSARSDLRAVESLATRHRLAAAEAARRREQSQLDDLASSRAGATTDAMAGGAR